MGAVRPAVRPVSDAKPPASPLPRQPSLRQQFPPADAMAVPAVADGHLAGSESRNCKIRSRRPAGLSSGSPVPARLSRQYAVSRHAITCLALKPMRLGSWRPRVPHDGVMIRLWSMSARKPCASDGSDEERALVGSCLTPLPQDAGQRELHEVFGGLRFLVKTGAPWRWMLNELPPWAAVHRPAQRWLAAGRLEDLQRNSAWSCVWPQGATLDRALLCWTVGPYVPCPRRPAIRG
jgi:hypothetical protein